MATPNPLPLETPRCDSSPPQPPSLHDNRSISLEDHDSQRRWQALSPVHEHSASVHPATHNAPCNPALPSLPRSRPRPLTTHSHDITSQTVQITLENPDLPEPTVLRGELRRRFSAPLPINTRTPEPRGPVPPLNQLPRTPSDEDEDLRTRPLTMYSGMCSEILDFLFVSGERVACDRQMIARFNITHVVNCAAIHVPSPFDTPSEFGPPLIYTNLNMYDSKTDEDVTWFLYQVIHAIEEARRANGRILVHCIQGVSRSCAMAIGYIMWSRHIPYQDAFNIVRAARPICSPNIAFICNLREWGLTRMNPKPCVYRLAPHGVHDPETFVPKLCRRSNEYSSIVTPSCASLDPRTCFVIVFYGETAAEGGDVFLWAGKNTPPCALLAARKFSSTLVELEHARIVTESPFLETQEPADFFVQLGGKTEITEVADYRDLELIGRPQSLSARPSPPPEPLLTTTPPPPPNATQISQLEEFDESRPIIFVYDDDEKWVPIRDPAKWDLVPEVLLILYVPKLLALDRQLRARHFFWVGRSCPHITRTEEGLLPQLLPLVASHKGLSSVESDLNSGSRWTVANDQFEPESFWDAFRLIDEDDDEDEDDDDEEDEEDLEFDE